MAFMHNPHRIFGGPYSLTGVDEVNLFSQDRLDSGDPRLHFTVFFGEEPPPFTPPHMVAARSLVDGVEGYPISALNGRWIHVAGVWDRRGIAGTSDTVRLYVNGAVVAASKATDWGTTPCETRRAGGACFTDVAGCNDTCADTFAVDELKVWDYAKSNYGVCSVPKVGGKDAAGGEAGARARKLPRGKAPPRLFENGEEGPRDLAEAQVRPGAAEGREGRPRDQPGPTQMSLEVPPQSSPARPLR